MRKRCTVNLFQDLSAEDEVKLPKLRGHFRNKV